MSSMAPKKMRTKEEIEAERLRAEEEAKKAEEGALFQTCVLPNNNCTASLLSVACRQNQAIVRGSIETSYQRMNGYDNLQIE